MELRDDKYRFRWDINHERHAAGRSIYLYDDQRDRTGRRRKRLLFECNVSGAAIDEAGRLYIVPMGNNTAAAKLSWKLMIPMELLWHKDLGDHIQMGMPVSATARSLPGRQPGRRLDRKAMSCGPTTSVTEDIRLNEHMPSFRCRPATCTWTRGARTSCTHSPGPTP